MKPTLALILCALLLAPPAAAWNNTGHKAIAYAAYAKLNKKARARVDALLRAHPMFDEFSAGTSGETASRMVFANFATWPDFIRGDKHFVNTPRMDDDCKPVGTAPPPPGAVFAGFPDMERHQDWHYDDLSFSTDGMPTKPSCVPNALTRIDAILAELPTAATSDPQRTFDLPWLEHLVGDVHQPLHAVSRFTMDLPNGDRGGNSVILKGNSNLHSFWDNLPGLVDTEPVVSKLAGIIASRTRKTTTAAPQKWLEDSAFVARRSVYQFEGKGTKEEPVTLSDGYSISAKAIAIHRMGMAANRLAAVLNRTLGR
ncbi:MAG: S1/P1 nuclease [Bryobacteraceae bacterium]